MQKIQIINTILNTKNKGNNDLFGS